jgi:methyl-accepting chemotaxis protein
MKDSTSKVEMLVDDFEDVSNLVKGVNEKMDHLLDISLENTKSISEINRAIKNLDASINRLDGIMQAYKT